MNRSTTETSISSEQVTAVTSVCDVVSSISRHPKNQGNLETVGLVDLVDIIEKLDHEEKLIGLVERWLNLEVDLEVIAAQDLKIQYSEIH
ncbi:MAG TPA: hypothetical protein VK203_23955 [Nostocaceae cyanobacterium]|nr:hypothetical protein [Nostocaceae cyanobacterium]